MKNWMKTLLVVLCASFLFVRCDKVDDPYEGIAGGGGELIGDSIWSDTTHNFRKMYIEEFTGHTCFNCPRETKKLLSWVDTSYTGKVVMTSIHWGAFAEPQPDQGYPDDWRCKEGNEINDKFGVLSNPSILANRLQSAALGPGQWRAELDKIEPSTASPTLKLALLSIRNGSKNENKIIARGIALEDLSNDYTIGLMLITDSIIAPQKVLTVRDPNYVHRYMLRGSVGPSIGNSFISGGLSKGDTVIKEFNFSPNPTWDTTHLLIHAFVRNADTEEIIQAEKVHLTKGH